jgi:hypothetical protein
MTIPCSLGKTLEIGDIVYTTNRSDTYTFKKWAKVVGFEEATKRAVITTKGSPKSSKTFRTSEQLMCMTQQIEYNHKEYPENQV